MGTNMTFTRIKTSNGGEKDVVPKGDATTHAFVGIDYPHYETHAQNAYFAVYSALGNTDAVIEVRIQTADSAKRAHMIIIIDVALAATAQLWKGTTKTHEAGNALPLMNRDHDSTNTSGLTVCHTPGGTESAGSTLTRYIGSASASGRSDIGGTGGNRGEFKLSRNEDYLIRVTSRADANAMSIVLDYYEHTDKD